MTETTNWSEAELSALSPSKAKLLRLLLENETEQAPKLRPYPRCEGSHRVRLVTSWAQERLWFVDQFEGGGTAYISAVAVRLRGSLDAQALQRSLKALVQRHEVLRTVFESIEGEPKQVISIDANFPLTVLDLSNHDEAQKDELIRRQKIEESREPFDLQMGPLIRGRLIRVDEREHVLLVSTHHIVSDGWSMAVLVRDLVELYSSESDGGDSRLSPLPIQYSDYAQWQRQWLQGSMLETQLNYWRAHLKDAPAELELPKDRPRPAVHRYNGRSLRIVLNAQLSTGLKAFASRHQLTLFMVLYAGWALLLSRLSCQEDIVIGTAVANRRQPELDGLIGFFVNTLALRVRVSSDMSLVEFLARVKDVTLAAYDHQDMPFEQVVEALRPERTLSRNPIFQVMLVLQNNMPHGERRVSGLTVNVEDGVNEASKFDLLLSLEERGDKIVGSLNYDTDLFNSNSAERWIASFEVLLGSMIVGEACQAGRLPILADNERRELIQSFNEAPSVCLEKELVHELFEAQVARSPDAVAAMHGERSLTYTELNRKANRLANYLRSKSVDRDQVVGICVERSLDMVVGVLGILKAGGACMPLDPNYPVDRLRYMLEDASPRVVLSQRKFAAVLGGAQADIVELDDLEEVVNYADGDLSSADLNLTVDNLVYVIYTSGSTGRPKGTAMSHRSMINLTEWHRRTLRVAVGQRVLQYAALSFDVAFQEIFSTLCTGGTLVLVDEEVRRDARAMLRFLSDQCIERLFVPPVMLQNFAECFVAGGGGAEIKGLKDVITAGEQLWISPAIVEFFENIHGCRLHNHYGPTETHVVTALTLEGNPRTWAALPTIGRPISNTEIFVLDSYIQPVPVGVTGEIYIAGANVARGYPNRAELTAERFLGNPFSSGLRPTRMYKTGDLGRWRADGMIEYLGRSDEQIKIRGYRIEPGEIEARLARHSQVRDVVVVAREDVPGDKRLVAYLTRSDRTDPSVDDLRAHLKGELPEYMVPSAFVTLKSLPLTPSGKLDRRALPAPEAGAFANRPYEPPRGEVEEAIAKIWQELLHLDRVGRHDSFFELGGHSLLVIKALFKINDITASELRASDVYTNSTISELAACIRSGHARSNEFVELSKEARLDGSIVPRLGNRNASANAVLLTGSTGFLGRFVLAQLLHDTDATIFCLVRAASPLQAMSRLRDTLEKWDLWRGEFEPRVVAVPGDLRSPGLGLDHTTYNLLSKEINVIYHCGASMNHLETYAMAKAANVRSAEEIVRLAISRRPMLINYVSTLGVFSPATSYGRRVVDELSSIDHEKHSTSGGYAASKWVGEKVFMIAAERGVPCNIFRVGLAWADAQKGRYDELQREYRVLKSCLMSGYGIANFLYPSPPTPVDYVARAVVFLAQRHSDGGGLFHISSSRVAIGGVFERCNDMGLASLELLPLYEWICAVKRLHYGGNDLPIVPLVQYAFTMDEASFDKHQQTFKSSIEFDCSRTHRELEHAGIASPILDDNLLSKCVEDMLGRDAELRGVVQLKSVQMVSRAANGSTAR
jgi:amino acid adenylation domain-containing protein/thioester reductase-like protein